MVANDLNNKAWGKILVDEALFHPTFLACLPWLTWHLPTPGRIHEIWSFRRAGGWVHLLGLWGGWRTDLYCRGTVEVQRSQGGEVTWIGDISHPLDRESGISSIRSWGRRVLDDLSGGCNSAPSQTTVRWRGLYILGYIQKVIHKFMISQKRHISR